MTDPLLVLAQALLGTPEEKKAALSLLDRILVSHRKQIEAETAPPEPDPGPFRDKEGRLRDSAGVLVREQEVGPAEQSDHSSRK